MAIATIAASCGSNGEKAATSEAETIKTENADEAISFSVIDEGSYLDWKASHLGGVQERFGKVSFKEATVLVKDGKVSNATILMDMTSLTVENFPEGAEEKGKLTGHLLGPDFFNKDTYPNSKFELSGIESNDGEFNSSVAGNLTILDVTKSITFKSNVSVEEDKVSIVSENFTVDRTDWGLKYNVKGTAGVPVDYLIDNEVGFKINLILSK